MKEQILIDFLECPQGYGHTIIMMMVLLLLIMVLMILLYNLMMISRC